MLRYLRYLVIAVFGLALLLVAVANRAPVVVRALPESMSTLAGGDWAVQMPVFVLIFLGIAVGVLVGFLWEWLRESKHRSTASAKAREVSKLERELAVMKDSAAIPPQDEVLALLDRRKAG